MSHDPRNLVVKRLYRLNADFEHTAKKFRKISRRVSTIPNVENIKNWHVVFRKP